MVVNGSLDTPSCVSATVENEELELLPPGVKGDREGELLASEELLLGQSLGGLVT